MHIENLKSVKIHHALADIKIQPHSAVNADILRRLIYLALDSYAEGNWVSGDVIHQETKKRHGDYYRTPGYYVRLYRLRQSLTQEKLAKLIEIKQHHLSEIENNKRSIGKKLAKKLADTLKIDYHKLLSAIE